MFLGQITDFFFFCILQFNFTKLPTIDRQLESYCATMKGPIHSANFLDMSFPWSLLKALCILSTPPQDNRCKMKMRCVECIRATSWRSGFCVRTEAVCRRIAYFPVGVDISGGWSTMRSSPPRPIGSLSPRLPTTGDF